RRPTTLEIIAWELAAPNHLTHTLNRARLAVATEYLDRFLPESDIPDRIHLRRIMQTLAFGVVSLIVRGRTTEVLAAGSFDQEETWDALSGTITSLVRGVSSDFKTT
ncbi:MAG: hypothetical protein AAGB34_07850, partial [Planctomycetota bacterium]